MIRRTVLVAAFPRLLAGTGPLHMLTPADNSEKVVYATE